MGPRHAEWTALVAAAALAAALARSSAPPSASGTHDPAAALDARRAYLAGVDLSHRSRHSESLPYFRRALGLRPDLWQVHCDYAAALINSVGQARPGAVTPRSTTRSSWERAAMMREGLLELDHAERLAATPLDSAYVIAIRAQTLAIWGLSWDGLLEYSREERLDPASAELRRRHEQLRQIMRAP
jgi:hypothetical protein